MRVLFAALASVGHTYPMVPLAIAAREAGHDVHFAVGEDVHPALAANGLNPFRPADSFYEIYPEDLAPDLERLHPDLVIHGWGVPGAAIAAARAGIPGLWHGFGRMFPDGIGLELPSRVAEAATRPHLDICPPSLQDKDFTGTPLRPVPFGMPAPLPEWTDPLVYLTLGTAFGTRKVLQTILAGLAALPVDVIVASGKIRLDVVPDNVIAREWVPQAQLLPHASVVVHHGGSGTTLGALAAGVPQLVLPQGADQFTNATALTEAGAALRLLPEELTTTAVADAVRTLLPHKGNDHRDAARAIAAEIAGMPAPEDVARTLPDYT